MDFYEQKLFQWIQAQIKLGQKSQQERQKDKLNSARESSQSKGILYDLIDHEKQSKYQREDNDDLNYLVNRSIAQNLHFFFSAFLSIFTFSKVQQDKDLLPELYSPSSFSVNSATSPGDNLTRDSRSLQKAQTPTPSINYDKAKKCIIDILQNYKDLLQTKDQELMHHVLFSFHCLHREITKITIWQSIHKKGLGDQIRELYLDVVKNHIIPAEEVVKNCWRYHLTFLRVLESLLDSSEAYNL